MNPVSKLPFTNSVRLANLGAAGFKARIVGCGYSQIEGVDFSETFGSTPKADTLRCFFCDANQNELELCEADAVRAFTQAPVEEDLYMQCVPRHPNSKLR